MPLSKEALKRRLTIVRDGEVAWIELTQGKRACIDAADIPLVEGRIWFAVSNRGTFYARSETEEKQLLLHRVITSCPDGMEVDHRDNDGLNNRRANLRVCTHAENTRNSRGFASNPTGIKGVSLYRTGRYHARIGTNGKQIYLGYYDTAEEAAQAYNKAALKHHGEFAKPAENLLKAS